MAKGNRYLYLPTEYHQAHDYCEFVLSQIEELIVDDRFSQLRQWTFKFPKATQEAFRHHTGDVFTFLEERSLTKEIKILTAGQLINSLLIETSYCLQEAFGCSLKMRLTVSFILFRKPFSEILIVYMQLLCNSGFLDAFIHNEGFNPTTLSLSDKKKYLVEINDNLLSGLYNVDDLFDLLFSKDEESITTVGNFAVHLYTDRHKVFKTDKHNLNFIFSNIDAINDQWAYIYDNMPMLVTFLCDVADLCVMNYTSVSNRLFFSRFDKRYKMRDKFLSTKNDD